MIKKSIWRIWLNDTEKCPYFKKVNLYENLLITLDNYKFFVDNSDYVEEAIKQKNLKTQ